LAGIGVFAFIALQGDIEEPNADHGGKEDDDEDDRPGQQAGGGGRLRCKFARD